MKEFKNSRNEFFSRKLLATVAISVLLAGCSSVPDAINPVEWYKSARDAIAGDDDAKADTAKSAEKPVPGENEAFPKLSSVPAKPKATVEEERKRIADGLVADREESRKYSSEVIRRQGDAANPLPAPPPPSVNLQPAPPPQPKAPVVSRSAPAPKPVVKAMPKVTPKPTPKMKPMTAVQPRPQSTTPQLRVAPPSPSVRIPAVNPNPPRMGAIPGINTGVGPNETVVISGGGVQTLGGAAGLRSTRARASTSNVNIPGTRSLNDFQPDGLQGSYQVATILFDNGSSRVKSRARRVLRQVIAQHKQVGGTLRVIGHASRRTKTNDPIRHKMANFQVSTARAERVAKELVKMGVKANKLFVGSVSDSEPKYHEYMPSGEAGNRRTEIYIDF